MKQILTIPFLSLLVGQSAWAKGLLEYRHYQRLNTPAAQSAQDGSVGINWSDDGKWRKFRTFADASIEVNTTNNKPMVSVSQAYGTYDHGRTELHVGRKYLPWNDQEAFWAIGEINPMRGFSWLETEREGIMGLHFRRKQWLEVGGFVSPMNIPQINPSFTTESGKVTGLNEWAQEPPRAVRFRGQDIPVYYDVDRPDVQDVVFHPGAGIDIGHRWNGGRVVAYGAYKPENQIRVNATGFYEQTSIAERAFVRTRPFMAYHQIIGGGVEHSGQNFFGKVHYDTIRPIAKNDQKFEFESLKIEPTYNPEHYLTASSGYQNDFYQLSLHTIVRTKGVVDNTTAFSKKPKWERALGLETKLLFSDRLSLRFLGRRDIKNSDVTLHSEFEWKIRKHVWLQVGLEMIDSPSDVSFWSPYRTNDTMTTAIGWLF